MPQSTQSVVYLELERTVGRFIFASTSPTGADQTLVDDVIRRGLRKFYMPPPLAGENYAHVWSFLKKKGSLDVRALASGTATSNPWNGTGIVDTAATFTTAFEGHNLDDGEALIDKTVALTDVSAGIRYYSIVTAVTNATTLVVSPTWSNTPSSSTTDTYKVTPADWDLPEDFGALIGDMTYRERSAYPSLKLVSESRIRNLRQDSSFAKSTRPQFVAIRAKSQQTESADAQSGADEAARWELMIWPDPDADYTLEYQYWVELNEITTTLSFPAGAIHGEAIMAACMWVAQEFADPQNRQFNMQARFIEALTASVMFDRQLMGGEHGGYNRDDSDTRGLGRPFRDRVSNVTVGGVEFP